MTLIELMAKAIIERGTKGSSGHVLIIDQRNIEDAILRAMKDYGAGK